MASLSVENRERLPQEGKSVQKRLKFWGWGYEDETVPESEIKWMESTWAARFGVGEFKAVSTPKAEEIKLPAARSVDGEGVPLRSGA